MPSHLKPILAILLLFFTISSCQKELSFENGLEVPGGTNGGTAQYSLSGAPDSCTGAIVSGVYTAGAALATGNTVTVKVVVDSIGTYSISTGSTNGIAFAATGSFTATGEQSIILKGTGTPTTAGVFTYTPGANGCIFNITVNGGATPVPPGDCKSCSYIPLCIGSKYTYEINNNGVTITLQQELLSPEIDTTVNGIVYKKIEARYDYSDGRSTKNYGYYNCTNNTSTAFAYQVTSINGTSTINFLKSTFLKANEPVLSTWTDIITNQGGQPVTMIFTLAEKDITHTVLGKTFDSVMHVTYTQTMDLLGNTIEAGKGDYFYAKHIGLIENYGETIFGQIGTWKLKDYFIP